MQTNETGALVLTTANGIDVPVRFGLATVRRLCKTFQCSLKDLPRIIQEKAQEDQIDVMLQMVKAGAESEAALGNSRFDFNEEQILSTLDKPGAFQAVMSAFEGSFTAFSDPSAPVATTTTETDSGKSRASKKAGETSGEK
jgi:hypothetical protein